MQLLDQLGLQYLIEKFKERFDLKQDKLTAGDNITIDNNVISASGGSIVDLGAFDYEGQVISYVIMNQLPAGHYTFHLDDVPCFMLLERLQNTYFGTFHDTVAQFFYFKVSIFGEIKELKTIDLRDLMIDVSL